jgi:hypothetical protein
MICMSKRPAAVCVALSALCSLAKADVVTLAPWVLSGFLSAQESSGNYLTTTIGPGWEKTFYYAGFGASMATVDLANPAVQVFGAGFVSTS